MKKKNKILLVLSPLIIFGIVVCLFFSPVIFFRIIGLPDYFRNNEELKSFAKSFYDYPLPKNSQVQQRTSYVTLLGNGNHCDFVVEQVIITDQSELELANYYKEITFLPVRSEPQGFEDSYTGGIHPMISPRIEPISWNGQNIKQAYKITIIDFGYPPGFDYRCN